ncbi:Protein of unknown function [Asanoa hainanensis]|uniref:DUF4240 domain-containing protein n=1 Tax=Asanoa hainanensis TaxID=560556 RepID=A0A239G552_9ACTN|nr:DUF4240 domain-containing protein [Asanoa hainanensis]SNS64211.1 Protein of unknown function [Asanoa hainanensis]
MDVDRFWALLAESATGARGRDAREAFLREHLLRADRADLLDFVAHLSATREPANTYRLWHAADFFYEGYCSGDSFHYFQMWLVGLGRDAYDAAVADPDSLAAHPAVQRLAALPQPWADDDYPEWETLEYVAVNVGNERPDVDGDVRDVLTEERGIHLRFDPHPVDVEWRQPDMARAYPRMTALCGPLPHS